MIKNTVFAVGSLLVLAGCASNITSFDGVEEEGKKIVEDAYKHSAKQQKFPFVRYSKDYFVPTLNASDADKPSWFIQTVKGEYLDYTLSEVMADELSKHGVNIRYLDGIDEDLEFSIGHDGTLGELLDKISFATKYSYSISGDLLSWSKFETKKLDVSFIAGNTDFFFGSEEGNGDSGNANSASGSTAEITDTGFSSSDDYINFSAKDISVWKDLTSSIELLKSKEGEFTISQSTSSILVKDYPDNVAEIEAFLKSEDERLTRMVTVDVQIIEYTSDKSDQRGINWKVVKEDLASGGTIGLDTAFKSLFQDDLAPSIIGYSQKTGKYAGSEVLINILDKYGAVSEVANHRIASLNNQVAKIIKGQDIGYLAQSGGTSTANVGSQDNLVPGILKTGDSVFMLPNAVGDKVIIQLSTKLTGEGKLRPVTSGDRSIETPQTTFSDIFLKFAVKDGETLLISGSSEKRREYNENSTGGALILGGEVGGTKSHKETLVLITPRIIK